MNPKEKSVNTEKVKKSLDCGYKKIFIYVYFTIVVPL